MISEIGRRMVCLSAASTTQKYVEKHWKERGREKEKERERGRKGGVAEGII